MVQIKQKNGNNAVFYSSKINVMNITDQHMQHEIETGQAPKEAVRIDDTVLGIYKYPHLHLTNKSAINKGGTWVHPPYDDAYISGDINSWLETNAVLTAQNNCSLSGHINDICPSNRETSRYMLNTALSLLQDADVSILGPNQKLLLLIYLKQTDTKITKRRWIFSDLEKQELHRTPPEFVICNNYIQLQTTLLANKINITDLPDCMEAYFYSSFEKSTNLYEPIIILCKTNKF